MCFLSRYPQKKRPAFNRCIVTSRGKQRFFITLLNCRRRKWPLQSSKVVLLFSMFLLVKDIVVNLNNNQIIKTIRFIKFPELLRTFEIIYIIRRRHFYRFIMSGIHY